MLPLALPTLYEQGSNVIRAYRTRPLFDILQDSTRAHAVRRAALDTLWNRWHVRKFPPAELAGVDLRSVRAFGANFSGSNFTGAHLDRAHLARSNLTSADLTEAHLSEAHLEEANLGNAKLIDADLTGADLTGARLRNADLRGANFEATSLEDADFTDAVVEDADFTETAWWMAAGWREEQIAKVMRRWPPDSFATTARFRAELEDRDLRVRSAKRRVAPIRGPERPGVVPGAPRRGPGSGSGRRRLGAGPGAGRSVRPGYPWLHLADAGCDFARAREALWRSVQLESRTDATHHYHLALVEDYLGHQDVAEEYYGKADSAGYEATYERVLTPRPSPRVQL